MVNDPAARPPAPNAAVLLIALGRRVGEQVEARLTEHDLTYRHLSALGHLAREPELSYSELARRAGITVQSMHATLAQLEKRGAVARSTTPGRGRTARLQVTTAGADLLRTGTALVTDVERELLDELAGEQREPFTRTLLQLFTRRVEARRDPPKRR